MMAKYLRYIVGDGESREGASGDEELLAYGYDFDELGWIAVEMTMLPASLAAIVPVFRRARRRLERAPGVIGAVAGHGDEAAFACSFLMYSSLSLGWLVKEVVDPASEAMAAALMDCRGDHHGADTHGSELTDALPSFLL